MIEAKGVEQKFTNLGVSETNWFTVGEVGVFDDLHKFDLDNDICVDRVRFRDYLVVWSKLEVVTLNVASYPWRIRCIAGGGSGSTGGSTGDDVVACWGRCRGRNCPS